MRNDLSSCLEGTLQHKGQASGSQGSTACESSTVRRGEFWKAGEQTVAEVALGRGTRGQGSEDRGSLVSLSHENASAIQRCKLAGKRWDRTSA